MQPVSDVRVALELSSATRSLAELRSALGDGGDPGSRDRGDPRPGGRVFAETMLRIEPGAPPGSTLAEQARRISARLPPARVAAAGLALGDLQVVVSVAAFFTTAACTVALDAELLEWVRGYGATLEVAAYPSS